VTSPVAGIEVRGLTRTFGDVQAVSDLDFVVPPGSVYGLLGPNGAGKTTTLRMLGTLLAPTAGEAIVNGFNISSHPEDVRRNVGFLTADTALYPRLNPQEVLRYFGALHGVERDLVEERIVSLGERLEFTPFITQRCGTLSTGQRQRVSIARALIHAPDVLILDEPTAGLDMMAADFIGRMLDEERRAGRTIVLSTHVLAEAELLCDRIGLIQGGRMVTEGTVSELQSEAGEPSLAAAILKLLATHGGSS
jgi:sodium transport system ATP-binding protein